MIHLEPEEVQANARKGTICIEVSTDWIAVKGNEDYVVEGPRYKLQRNGVIHGFKGFMQSKHAVGSDDNL